MISNEYFFILDNFVSNELVIKLHVHKVALLETVARYVLLRLTYKARTVILIPLCLWLNWPTQNLQIMKLSCPSNLYTRFPLRSQEESPHGISNNR